MTIEFRTLKQRFLRLQLKTRDQFVVRFEIDDFETFLIRFALFKSPFITKRDLIRNNFNINIHKGV